MVAPRIALTACCSGVSTCIATKTMPTKVSGPASVEPSRTAPTSTPVEIASSAGIAARSRRSAHHPAANRGAARNSTRKNVVGVVRAQPLEHQNSTDMNVPTSVNPTRR